MAKFFVLAFAAFGISLVGGAPAFAAADMSFHLTHVSADVKCGRKCPKAIIADGEIVDSTPDDFLRFVKENSRDGGLRSVIFLHSPGGKVIASMELGKAFRAVGAATIVAQVHPDEGGRAHLLAGACLSACVYALMGGVKRVAPMGSRVGVHRMFTYETGQDPAGDVSARKRFDDGGMRAALSRYAAHMGVSSDLIVHAEQSSSESIRLLSREEIARWRLAAPRF